MRLPRSPPAAQLAPLGADLPSLFEYARSHNPELAAMQRESDAAAQRIQPAGALPDPVLRVEIEKRQAKGRSTRPGRPQTRSRRLRGRRS